MNFRIEISPRAERDGEEISEWLLMHHAGETGLQWLAGMSREIASLETFPKRCALAPESRYFVFEVRQLLYGRKPHSYRILFTIEADVVYILHIRRPGQQLIPP
ncbi:MAG: type II toxin-antitoxin system RelE/ParE family toxin [Bryobacteraceae bacterium]|nr:type II toxin-antitoxin system RelE/ParE family toxin [Bryobacteraceae bacterium]